jgi:hypothetical protein
LRRCAVTPGWAVHPLELDDEELDPLAWLELLELLELLPSDK